MGLCPIPQFILCLNAKNEARKVNLPAGRQGQNNSSPLCRKAGISNKVSQAPLLKFQALQHYSRRLLFFKGVHKLLRNYTSTPTPRFVGATAQCFDFRSALFIAVITRKLTESIRFTEVKC